MIHGRRLFLAFLLAIVALGVGTAVAAADDRLPDLRMSGADEFSIDTKTVPGHRLLRYTAIILNEGVGPLEVHGQRPDTSTRMSVTQRIYDGSGGYRDVPTSAAMYFAGDGHHHWHVRNLESSRLRPLGSTSPVLTSAKHGFCLTDGVFWVMLPGSPPSSVYTDCGDDPRVLEQTMGLSVGYADVYGLNTNFQWIDITDLPDGDYRIRVTADAANRFLEVSDSNNFTWTNLRIERNRVRVLAIGPHG
jgi:hypothetical protein